MSWQGRRSHGTASTRSSLRRRVGRAFAALLTLLAVLMAAVVFFLVDFIHKDSDLINRWQPAVSTSENLLADLVNQETGVRGYSLGRRGEFLTPYHDYRKLEVTDEATLRRLVSGHGALNTDLGNFIAAVRSWRTQIAEPTITRVRTNDSSAYAEATSQQAKNSFDEVRTQAARLSSDIRRAQRAAISQRRRGATLFSLALAVTAVLVLAAGVVVWRGLRRSVLDPIEHLAEQTRQIARGDVRQRIVASGPPELAALGTDVDRMRARIADELAQVDQARADLQARTEDLARSNADLEQFAYIASHDLSEPLRKITNFCQLLERQYGPQLDDKARQYIAFAVDGARRMQLLIADLLAFSRVGRAAEGFEQVDTEDALSRAIANLDASVTESHAEIVHSPLPTVWGDATLLTALFQNLVGNAVKYRGAAAPLVEITVEHRENDRLFNEWLFTVSDNGIGIDPIYADRIFAIFQRLHLRDQYGGTGIGLALCRKIVEFHGGRIWLAPTVGPGAKFHFTIPDSSGMADRMETHE